LQQLGAVHSLGYLALLDDPDAVSAQLDGAVAASEAAAVRHLQRLMTGATVEAARVALETRRPVINLGGGFHHAHPDAAGGFCLFNDVAVAVANLRSARIAGRVFVVDLDLHQGDGTRRIFADDPSVFTLSIHNQDWDSDPIPEGDINLALGPAVGDGAYLEALQEHLPDAFSRVRPELVFYVAGVDVAGDDRLGNWRVSHDAIFQRDRMVIEATGELPLVWLLAGGYGEEAWRHSARSLSWLLGGPSSPIPTAVELDLQRFRRIARSLSRAELATSADDDELVLTEADLMEDLGGAPATRVLGFYSQHGVEVALARYGILEHLAGLGYDRVRVEIDPRHATGELIRLISDDGREHLLIELVVRTSHAFPPYRLLFIEWLLMQNPSARPSAERPLLPGQAHPGLGCAEQLLEMLVMACERLEFDGLAFAASQYHIAAMAKQHFSFMEPSDEALMHSIAGADPGARLSETSLALASGQLRDRDGTVVRWSPGTMAHGCSEALKARFEGPEYERAVLEATRPLRAGDAPSKRPTSRPPGEPRRTRHPEDTAG